MSLNCWSCNDFHVHFGDNDGVRFSLFRACGTGDVAQSLMGYYLALETKKCSRTWFARVPTEANISDLPSRKQQHSLLAPRLDESLLATEKLDTIMEFVIGCGVQRLKRGNPDVADPQQKNVSAWSHFPANASYRFDDEADVVIE